MPGPVHSPKLFDKIVDLIENNDKSDESVSRKLMVKKAEPYIVADFVMIDSINTK